MKELIVFVFILVVLSFAVYVAKGTEIYHHCDALLEKNHLGIDRCTRSCIGVKEGIRLDDADAYRCHGIPGPYKCFGIPYTVTNLTGKEHLESLDCDYSCNDEKVKNECLAENPNHLGECEFLIDRCNW